MSATLPAFLLSVFGLSCGSVCGVVVRVELEDYTGPHWIGFVDTSTDTFTLESWSENPGRNSYWTPAASSLPITMMAFDSTGALYDVADNFAITGIGPDWGFFGPDVGDITWNEGVTRWGGQGLRISWGASATTEPGFVPVGSAVYGTDFTRDASGGGVLLTWPTIIHFGSSFDSVTIPEPGPGMFLIPALVASFWRRVRKVAE